MIIDTSEVTEVDRNQLIKSYGFVEHLSSNEHYLSESLQLAMKLSNCPIAYISLIDDEKQYILSQEGSSLVTMDLDKTICQNTIQRKEILVIENLREDERTMELPSVNCENGVVFYAGYPLINNQNICIGALCVMDYASKELDENQRDMMKVLGRQIMNTLDNQRSMIALIKKINTNFKPAACADLSCLTGELDHLQTEVITQNSLVKKQKEALEKSNKELSSFAYVVAHDVRAPLRTIGSFAQLLEKNLIENEVDFKAPYLAFIKKAVLNLDELTQDLLAFAEIDRGTKEMRNMSLRTVLDNVLFNLTDTINEKNVLIQVPKDDVMVMGHNSEMIQLFQNIISNGIKYQPDGRRPLINITSTMNDGKVAISISDNGIGMSTENLKDIFKPFKRLHNKEKYSGSGIGLATCKKILDKLESKFVVTSNLNEGSEFSFELPIA